MAISARRRRWKWEPEVGDHVRAIWDARWFVLLGALAIAGGVLVWRLATPDQYDSTSRLRIVVLAEGDVSLDEDRLTLASRIYAELADSRPLREEAVRRSGIDLSIEEASSRIEVERSSPPGFVDIIGKGGSAATAARLADGMAEVLADAVVEDHLGQMGVGDNGLVVIPEVVERAETPANPVSPRPFRESGIAFLASMLVLAELAVAARLVSGRLPLTDTAERVERMVGVTSVELTGDLEDRTKLALFAARRLGESPAAIVVQCGGWPNPAVALRLAEAIAGESRRVLVVDGDAASPTLDGQLGLTRSPGLTDVLSGRSQLPETVHHPDESSQVSVLTVGANAGARRWTSNDLTRLFSYSRKARRFDGVVVSLTSAAMPDGVALGMELGLHQAVVLAVDPTRTKRRQLGELIHAFGGPDEVCGLLLVTNETAAVEMRRLARRWGSASSVMDRGLESETSPEELS